MRKIVFAVAMLASSAVFAQTEPRYYGGIELGAAKLDDATGDFLNSFVGAYGGAASATQDSTIGVARFFLGYRITEKFAVEGGYFNSNKANLRLSGVTGLGAPYTASAGVDYAGIDVSAVWFPMAEKMGDAGFFLKGGLHHAELNGSLSVTGVGGTAGVSFDDSGTGSLIGIGYDWKFTKDAFARIAATRYLRVAGDSENNATVYSLAIGTNF